MSKLPDVALEVEDFNRQEVDCAIRLPPMQPCTASPSDCCLQPKPKLFCCSAYIMPIWVAADHSNVPYMCPTVGAWSNLQPLQDHLYLVFDEWETIHSSPNATELSGGLDVLTLVDRNAVIVTPD